MEEKRTKLRAQLCHMLVEAEIKSCSCGWGLAYARDCKRILAKTSLVDIFSMPVSKAIAMLASVTTGPKEGSKYCSVIKSNHKSADLYADAERLQRVEKDAGISIESIRMEA